MPDNSATSQQKTLSIVPATADVNANAICHFTVDPPGTNVTWDLKPKIGKIDSTGTYQAPPEDELPESLVVIATTASGDRAVASIELTDAPKWIRWLGWYAIIVTVVLGVGILAAWSRLYVPPDAPLVVVNPALVTLDPLTEEKMSFTATVVGHTNQAVTWSISKSSAEIDSNGFFQRKAEPAAKEDSEVVVTARSVADPSRAGTAVVRLVRRRHLEIAPQVTTVSPHQQIPFRTTKGPVKWSITKGDLATVSQEFGTFTAGPGGPKASLVQVTARSDDSSEQAGLLLVIPALLGPADGHNWLLIFVVICGALGSMIYYVTSFVGYVGNRTFRSSWFWFYISRPFVGGALAVIFFFIAGAGLISGTSGGELMKLGMLSALVGLFSDKAVKKLSDILDVLLATKDDRKDKVITETKAQSPARPPVPPKIEETDLNARTAGGAKAVKVRGRSFTGAKVEIDGKAVTPSDLTDTSFTVEVPPGLVAGGKFVLTVTTAQGKDEREIVV